MSRTHRVARSCDTAEERGSVLIGQLIGDYRLHRLLGRGGMGQVFEGIHERLGHHAAIKVVHAQLAQSPLIAARFHTEARAASLLEHPGVVRVFDVGQTAGGMSFIVMEYLDGVLLSDQLSRIFSAAALVGGGTGLAIRPDQSPVPAHAEFALRVAGQLAETLSALHEKGVVHRDLKPDNIFLVRDGRVQGGERIKIFDFGIAKLLCEPGAQVTPGSPGQEAMPAPRTAIGTVLGTPVYMSPEQWQGRSQITDRVDVYAAGGIFYELLVGHPPFTSRAIGELMAQHLKDMPSPVRTEAAWVPAPMGELIHRMLAKSPLDRPSMKEVADFFAHYQKGRARSPGAAAIRFSPPKETLGRPLTSSQTSGPAARYAADLAACQTQIIESQAPAPVLVSPPQTRPKRRQPQAPPILGFLLVCMLGLLLTSMAAWFLAPTYP